MSGRVLVVPAAGLGSRLRSPLPKLLVPVNGVPMIDRLLALYSGVVERTIVVTSPSAFTAVASHLRSCDSADVAVQPAPTGMLDAILVAGPHVAIARPRSIWITWCDQVAVHQRTVDRLVEMSERNPRAAIVMPTVHRSDPYVHFERDDAGRIARVLHRREGDRMPSVGESDMGLFAVSAPAFFTALPQYAREVTPGTASGERNFLPFIPWIARQSSVVTFPSEHVQEAVGINTPEELDAVETYLRQRDA